MLQLILITGCLAAVSHAFVSPSGIYTGAGGLTIDFNVFRNSPKALEGICNAAVMQNGGRATDALSDVMRNAVDYFATSLGATGNPTVLGSGSPQWTCLLQASTANGMNPGNAANGVGDYYDTVVELPINHLLPFAFNPCSMVFCGEQGMTPMAIAMEVSRRLQFRQPLGNLANYFGSYANMLNQPQRLPGPGAGLAGMMPGMNGGANLAGGVQNPLAQMSSLLAKMQSPMGNPGSPNAIPNPSPAGAASPPSPAAAAAAAQPPPAPISSPDAAAAGATSGTGSRPPTNAAPTNGFMDMILKMQQMMKGGAAAQASPAAAPNPFASMMNMMGGMPNMMGGMPGGMGGMPNMFGGMSSMMGGMPNMMGGMPGGMGGMPGGMGGLMNMMAMNAAMQDAPDPVPGVSPFGGMAALGGMPSFSGMPGSSGSAGTAGGSTGGLMG